MGERICFFKFLDKNIFLIETKNYVLKHLVSFQDALNNGFTRQVALTAHLANYSKTQVFVYNNGLYFG